MKLIIKQTILRSLTVLFVMLSFSSTAYALPAAPTNYFASASTNTACGALNNLNPSESCGTSNLDGVIAAVVNIISLIVGIAAVIMIVVAGFQFITSGGDSNRVASAKSTIIYAIIGLVLVAIAQSIVHFAFNIAGGKATLG